MKKIGIITHYYRSQNYGGLLQAYALCKKINDMSCYAEQIQYIHEENSQKSELNNWNSKRIINGIKYRLDKLYNKKFWDNMRLRKKALTDFAKTIPHSTEVYCKNNIKQCNDIYDTFITGSDQVWNLEWYDDAYFLKFVEGKPKYSYAASLGTNILDDCSKGIFKENLKGYSAISVRENDSVDLIQPLTQIKVQYTLDPTLLLSIEEWDSICTKRLIKGEYLFCYFLGDEIIPRNLAKQFAYEHGLTVVTLPYLNGQKRNCDNNFGDICLYDISPADFISLIKYATCVFTDSFHACVFSNMYVKEFFVFNRDNSFKMSNRIVALGKLYGNEERFCNMPEKQCIEYLNSLNKKENGESILGKELEESIKFLDRIIQEVHR